ncbi:hypothetical protein Ddc_18756 [Ditylenchus destructor]|nr:hypothetical protein Ddc_18756 [Ditylenchus destructor]
MRLLVFVLALFSLKAVVSNTKLYDCLAYDKFFPTNYTERYGESAFKRWGHGLPGKSNYITDWYWVVGIYPEFLTSSYRRNFREIPCDINEMASNLKRCLNDKEKGDMLDRVIQIADALCKAEVDEKKLSGCIKSDEQGMKAKCPHFDKMISPELPASTTHTSCCFFMDNRECVVNRMRDGCRDFLANTTIVAHMLAYTVMEFNHNEWQSSKKQNKKLVDLECGQICAKLASGEKPDPVVRDGVVGAAASAVGKAIAGTVKNLKAGMSDAVHRVNKVGAKDHIVTAVLAVGVAAENVRDGAVDMAVRVGQAVADAATNVKEGAVNVAVGAKDHVVAGAEAVGDAA